MFIGIIKQIKNPFNQKKQKERTGQHHQHRLEHANKNNHRIGYNN